VVASSATESWVRERLAGDLMGPLSPAFILELGHQLQRTDDGIDLLLAARGLEGDCALSPVDRDSHPSVARAAAHRSDLRTFEDVTGEAIVVIGRGLAMRLEVAVEVLPSARGRGIGQRAFFEARQVVPRSEFIFAQIAPANTASLRALLRAGYTPVGSEVLFFDGPRALTWREST
jgi:GNAT superfamily N-acetyltransferase